MACKMVLEGCTLYMGFGVRNTMVDPVTTGTDKYGGGGVGRGGGR